MKKNTKNSRNISEANPEKDGVEFEGIIEEALPAAMFRVKCDGNRSILATLSGRLRVNNIRLVPGDTVTVEVSTYDLTRGRIMWRK
jgi:translation initiation factor IF-1